MTKETLIPISELFVEGFSLADGSKFFTCQICGGVGPRETGKTHHSHCPLSIEKTNLRNLKRILRYEWNPILTKNLPEDEYAKYIPRILELLGEGVSTEHLASTLTHIRTKKIGLETTTTGEVALDLKVAQRIREEINLCR